MLVSQLVLYNSALCNELESSPEMLSPQEGANTDQPLPHINFASEDELVMVKLGEGLEPDNTTKLALKNCL